MRLSPAWALTFAATPRGYARAAQVPLHTQSVSNLEAAWQELNTTVEGRLHVNNPIASPCYHRNLASAGSDGSAACAEIVSNKENNIYVSGQPSGYYFSNWASCQATGESCALPLELNVTVPRTANCSQGNLPDRYLEVLNESYITAALGFSAKTKIPLVVKNSGHDWKGRSSAPGALALWMHHFRKPIELTKDFKPEGCSSTVPNVLTFGAGEKWAGIYDFAARQNPPLMVVGGTCGDVGPAGWLAGGGHSPLSPVYGLGVDNVQQIKIILAAGTPKVVSRCNEPDLFFALTGGGGNTWGVVTEMTYQAHPVVKIQEYSLDFKGLDKDNAREFFTILTKHANYWADRGWGGYIYTQRKGRFLTLVNPVLSQAEAASDMLELTNFASRMALSLEIVIQKEHESWFDYFEHYFADVSVHKATWSASVASRLVPSDMFHSNQSSLVDTLLDLHYTQRLTFIIMLVTPRRHPDNSAYSLHPAWRNSTWLIRVNALWDQYYEGATPAANRAIFKFVHEAMESLRKLLPNSAVSMNEADIWEPQHQEAFWGRSNYNRLLQVKDKVDPESRLVVYQGVGWDKVGKERWKCYPKMN